MHHAHTACLSVCHSATYSLPQLIDHNQIWCAGTYLSSHPCKPFWIPCLPYSRFQMEKYGKFRLFPTLNGYHFDIRTQIKKSRRESTRMSIGSTAPKYEQIRSRNEGRVGFGVTQCRPVELAAATVAALALPVPCASPPLQLQRLLDASPPL